jgi:hypothetical protein
MSARYRIATMGRQLSVFCGRIPRLPGAAMVLQVRRRHAERISQRSRTRDCRGRRHNFDLGRLPCQITDHAVTPAASSPASPSSSTM